MPVIDGFEATAKIRAMESGSWRRTPIVGLTAHAMKGDRESCLAGGMDDYLAKHIQAEEFYAVVARHALPARQPQDCTVSSVGWSTST